MLRAEDEMAMRSGITAFEGKHFAMAMQLLSPLAEKGNADAQYRVAIMHQNGLIGSEDFDRAAKLMQLAAAQNHPLAQHGMAVMYMEGEGVEKDMQQAISWFEKAAEQGLTGSLTTLGMIFQEGMGGVTIDMERAKAYYRQAGFDMEA